VRVYAGAALALVVLAAGAWRIQAAREKGRNHALRRQRIEDRNNLRQIGKPVVQHGKLPMKDGAFDPYFFVRNGDLRGTNIKLLTSVRYRFGPTEEEAKEGDYSKFPWERYRGTREFGATPFPILWEPEPDRDGLMLVGLLSGETYLWDRATLDRALADAAHAR
jgi:hypothetical protein